MDAPNPKHELFVGSISVSHIDSIMFGIHSEDQDGWQQNEDKVEGVPSQIDACVSDKIFDRLGDI